jgi:hypothetical protein
MPNHKTDTKKKTLLSALEKSLGVVTTACKSVGLSRETHYKWMKEDEDYRLQVEEISSIQLDFVESKLIDRINNGDTTAIIFYLNSKGKTRGYNRHTEEKREQIKWPSNIVFNMTPDDKEV